jgi:hypothetical protein
MNTILDSDEKKATRPRQMTAVNPAQNPKVEHRIREFLKALNSGGGKPMETMTPAEARKVLVDAQASVRLDLPPCDIEAKTITQDGLEVSLTIVRPAGSKASCQDSSLCMAAVGFSATFRRTSDSCAISWLTAASPPSS